MLRPQMILPSFKPSKAQESYTKGQELEKTDPTKAANYYLQAALTYDPKFSKLAFLGLCNLEEKTKNNAQVFNALGQCYNKGIAIPPNTVKAISYYQRAIEQGFAPAGISLAICHFNNKQPDLALDCLQTTLNEETKESIQSLLAKFIEINPRHHRAKLHYAKLLLSNSSSQQNDQRAAEYLSFAATSKSKRTAAVASFHLAECNLLGMGVPVDLLQANFHLARCMEIEPQPEYGKFLVGIVETQSNNFYAKALAGSYYLSPPPNSDFKQDFNLALHNFLQVINANNPIKTDLEIEEVAFLNYQFLCIQLLLKLMEEKLISHFQIDSELILEVPINQQQNLKAAREIASIKKQREILNEEAVRLDFSILSPANQQLIFKNINVDWRRINALIQLHYDFLEIVKKAFIFLKDFLTKNAAHFPILAGGLKFLNEEGLSKFQLCFLFSQFARKFKYEARHQKDPNFRLVYAEGWAFLKKCLTEFCDRRRVTVEEALPSLLAEQLERAQSIYPIIVEGTIQPSDELVSDSLNEKCETEEDSLVQLAAYMRSVKARDKVTIFDWLTDTRQELHAMAMLTDLIHFTEDEQTPNEVHAKESEARQTSNTRITGRLVSAKEPHAATIKKEKKPDVAPHKTNTEIQLASLPTLSDQKATQFQRPHPKKVASEVAAKLTPALVF